MSRFCVRGYRHVGQRRDAHLHQCTQRLHAATGKHGVSTARFGGLLCGVWRRPTTERPDGFLRQPTFMSALTVAVKLDGRSMPSPNNPKRAEGHVWRCPAEGR